MHERRVEEKPEGNKDKDPGQAGRRSYLLIPVKMRFFEFSLILKFIWNVSLC